MFDYHIKRLGHRGDGITEEGYFAPLTLPQERISAEAEGKSLRNVKNALICRHQCVENAYFSTFTAP